MEPSGRTDALNGIDDDLLRRAQGRDPKALDELVSRLVPYVGKICASIALEDGDDALQEALVLIVRGLPALREPRALKSWVRRIALREAARAARARREHLVLDEEAAGAPLDLDLALGVRTALNQLTLEQRAVLVLRDLDGYSEREVAELLAVPEGTVKSRLHRARAAFALRYTR